MGFFDKFRKKKENKVDSYVSKKEQETASLVSNVKLNLDVHEKLSDTHMNNVTIDNNETDNMKHSSVISDEIITKIKQINKIDYISDRMLKRMEKYPKLVSILLEGGVSSDVITSLNYIDKMTYFPWNEDDLKFLEFFDIDETLQKKVSLLNNLITLNQINDDYVSCYMNLEEDLKTIEYTNQIESFIPNIKINLGCELLTKTDSYSSFILYFPKSSHKIINHDYNEYITGSINLNEDTIVQMSYITFEYLNDDVLNKIAKCKIVFSENNIKTDKITNDSSIDYTLVKYNHLIYIIEHSSLSMEVKEKLLYKIKNNYAKYKSEFFIYFQLIDKITPYLEQLTFDEIKQLSKEFEANIDIYKDKPIIEPKFNLNFFIEEHIPNLDDILPEDVIYFTKTLPIDLKISVLKEPKISEKLKIPPNLEEKELLKYVFLLEKNLSPTTMKFVRSLDFDIEEFLKNPYNDYKTSYDINPIISKYGVFDQIDETYEVSVADLLGHDGIINCGSYKGTNILYTFENFFKIHGDSYHTRALGLLDYQSGEQLLAELQSRNNDTLDMRIRKIENGKYIVSGNGLHRFTVLRFHYLLDLMKNQKTKEELRELYKIPVKLDSVANLKKSYCNYFIQKANPNISCISFDYKQDAIIIYYKSGEQSPVLNEEKLLSLAVESVHMLDDNSLKEVSYFYHSCQSFKEFIDKYIPNVLETNIAENKEVIKK